MRADQLKRLEDLSEKLADAFLLEADPAEWPGSETPLGELTQQQRGDRYWCKKNAMATGAVLRFTMDVMAKQPPPGEKPPGEGDDDLDKQVRDAERRAKKAVDDAVARAKRKPEFDRRTHGG